MLKLLIADDERVAREAICQLIDWPSLGINMIASCKNGIEALETAKDLRPDIVLTDIQMPGLSGLDLVGELSEIAPDTEFIIVTGYAKFEYAHRALTYGVHQYLLKPCNEEMITDAINQARQAIFQKQLIFNSEVVEMIPLRPFSEPVHRVMGLVEENYMQPDLTLKEIATNYLFMNSDYLSKEFKKETDFLFTDYLRDFRIRKAKWLLVNQEPVEDIPGKVGYSENSRYFNQLFKKSTGLSLRDYAAAIHIVT